MGTIFKSSGCTYKNIENFDCISPEEYPQQDNLWVKQPSLCSMHFSVFNSYNQLTFFHPRSSFAEFYEYFVQPQLCSLCYHVYGYLGWEEHEGIWWCMLPWNCSSSILALCLVSSTSLLSCLMCCSPFHLYQEIIPQFRQLVAYKLAKSDINEEDFERLQEDVSSKKRKKRH